MYSEFTEDHLMYQRAIRDFAEREIAPIADEYEEKGEYPVQIIKRAGEIGLLCPRYQDEGAGLGITGEAIACEELTYVSPGIASGINIQSGVATSILANHGSEAQKARYLRQASQGKLICAFALTEPNAGSDASAIETTATKQGDCYILNGTKMFITNGGIADFVLVAASTDRSKGAKGISVFVVEQGFPGFQSVKLQKVGRRSQDTAELAFTACPVPAENRIGEEGMGLRYLMECLSAGRVVVSAGCVGMAKAALDLSVAYAKQRCQFGQPIGRFQAVAFKLARMATQIAVARSFVYRLASAYDHGIPCRTETSMCKLFASEVAVRVTNEAMQIYGGYGYMMESKVQRYWRDAKLATIVEGTSEIQQMLIARGLGLL